MRALCLLGLTLTSCSMVSDTMNAMRENRQAIDWSTQAILENRQAIEEANVSIEENRRQLEAINAMLKKAGES